jgi:hypothetical protein
MRKLVQIELVSLIAILSVLTSLYYQHRAFAQTSNTNPASDIWIQVLLSGITAAAFSAGISAVVNHKMTLQEHKLERQVDVIKEKLNLYSYFFYQTKKMSGSSDFQEGGDDVLKVESIFSQIDSMLEKRFYLLSSSLINNWMEISGNRGFLYRNKQLGIKLDELRKKIRDEYNSQILVEYWDISGKYGIDKIPPD